MRIKSGFVRGGNIVFDVPQGATKQRPRAEGGYILMRTSGLKQARETAKQIPRSVNQAIEVTAQEKAERLQATLQGALAAEYAKTGTGRFARSVRVRVIKGKSSTGGARTSLQIYQAFNYRENRFLTNLGGGGYFKDFPVPPYRIYARGAQRIADTSESELSNGRLLARLIRRVGGASRLKVPRAGRFFTAGRKPGRGGGESRFINDILGPMDLGDRPGAFFFYPLWVTHPGFRRDLLSELALKEGSSYQTEVLVAVGDAATLRSKAFVASGIIPVPETEVTKEVAMPIFLKRVR